ncbi:hypothetical protein SHIRM173S_05914 [Streptomyces hirsutus]
MRRGSYGASFRLHRRGRVQLRAVRHDHRRGDALRTARREHRLPLQTGEIIKDGVDGRLVPVDDADALGEALLDLVGDDERRRRMGRAALDNARRYAPGPVVAQAERLAEEAVAARSTGRRPAPDGGRAHRNLSGQGHAAADLALAAASEALRTLRKGRR